MKSVAAAAGLVVALTVLYLCRAKQDRPFAASFPDPAHPASALVERAHEKHLPERVLVPAHELPKGFSSEPVYTVSGADYLEEEILWAHAYAKASVEELYKAKKALGFVYKQEAVPLLAERRRSGHREYLGESTPENPYVFRLDSSVPSSVWVQGNKAYAVTLPEDEYPEMNRLKREIQWLTARIRVVEREHYLEHLKEKGPGYDHAQCWHEEEFEAIEAR